jgi:hypothetical protein
MNTTVLTRGVLVATGLLAAVGVSACTGSLTASGTANPGSTSSAQTTVDTTVAQPAAGGFTAATQPPANVPPAVAATRSPLTPECKAPSLKLSFGGGDAGMSQQYRVLRFTNVGSRSCVIVGFPGVSYVAGAGGTQVGAPAVRDGKIGAQVTLAPGAVASTVIHSVDPGVFDPNACQPTAVRGYRVYAPDDTAAMFIPLSGQAQGCAGTTPDPQLSVVTIKPGPGNPAQP